LAFDFPTGRKDRSAFFRDELEALFVLCRSEGIDPLALKGSYAGAFGMPQFMPSSFNRYASTSMATATSTCIATRPT
jgi:membrane-bound lytic murein transglycosylase B